VWCISLAVAVAVLTSAELLAQVVLVVVVLEVSATQHLVLTLAQTPVVAEAAVVTTTTHCRVMRAVEMVQTALL